MKQKPYSFLATTFLYGNSRTICSKHRTMYAAERAAKKCEKEGGAFHDEIWFVIAYPRERVKK